jgi:hypothetical protein
VYIWDTEVPQHNWDAYINPLRGKRKDRSQSYETFQGISPIESLTLNCLRIPDLARRQQCRFACTSSHFCSLLGRRLSLGWESAHPLLPLFLANMKLYIFDSLQVLMAVLLSPHR